MNVSSPCKTPDDLIEIDDKTYDELAARLLEAIGADNFFNGTIEYDTPLYHTTLRTTLIIYRQHIDTGQGDAEVIANIVPVWWELDTADASGCVSNDMDWNTLKKYLII